MQNRHWGSAITPNKIRIQYLITILNNNKVINKKSENLIKSEKIILKSWRFKDYHAGSGWNKRSSAGFIPFITLLFRPAFRDYKTMPRSISPEVTAPLCANCQTPTFVCDQGEQKVWKCPNRVKCGGLPIPYFERRKRAKKKRLGEHPAETRGERDSNPNQRTLLT